MCCPSPSRSWCLTPANTTQDGFNLGAKGTESWSPRSAEMRLNSVWSQGQPVPMPGLSPRMGLRIRARPGLGPGLGLDSLYLPPVVLHQVAVDELCFLLAGTQLLIPGGEAPFPPATFPRLPGGLPKSGGVSRGCLPDDLHLTPSSL